MERNSLSDNLKDHTIRDCSNNNNNRVKGPWESSSNSYAEDYIAGFSWPPRSYICSFCKREFRSAQALGGHMNVHRRDRARLRQSPPPPRDQHHPILTLNLNSNPNPNPNPNFSPPSTTRLPSYACTLPSLVSPSLSSSSSVSPNETKKLGVDGGTLLNPPSSLRGSNFTKMKTTKSFFGVKEFDDLGQEDDCKITKQAEIVRLDLGIGLLSDSKEDVDLELRLGYC